jgi:putative Mn2+ efflux pump MntP
MLVFLINSILLGFSLAMDAFSVCVANGLNESDMDRQRKYKMAAVFGGFQALMPMIGWVCVRTISGFFEGFQRFIPWIALILLGFIGGKMILDSVRGRSEGDEVRVTSIRQLFVQGIATSIDALSVGFTIADYEIKMAVSSALIIGLVTFVICMAGLKIGQKAGMHLSGKASIVGGIILILIGLEIFLDHIL